MEKYSIPQQLEKAFNKDLTMVRQNKAIFEPIRGIYLREDDVDIDKVVELVSIGSRDWSTFKTVSRPIGCMASYKDSSGVLVIGWSICNPADFEESIKTQCIKSKHIAIQSIFADNDNDRETIVPQKEDKETLGVFFKIRKNFFVPKHKDNTFVSTKAPYSLFIFPIGFSIHDQMMMFLNRSYKYFFKKSDEKVENA